MLTSVQSAGVTSEVNLRNSLHTGDKARKRGIPGFGIQERHYQKSKTGVSVAPKKGLISSKKILKKKMFSLKRESILSRITNPDVPNIHHKIQFRTSFNAFKFVLNSQQSALKSSIALTLTVAPAKRN